MKYFPFIASFIGNVILIVVLGYAVYRLGGPNAILQRIQSGGVAEAYIHRTKILEILPMDATNIIFLGNSLTEYGEWNEFFQNPDIRNRGIAGEFTDGILRRLTPITNAQPRQIFLLIGVNDLILHRPSHILKNYRAIVKQITTQTPETELIVQSLLPVNNQVKNTRLDNADILAINKGIAAIATEYNLVYVDLHAIMKSPDGQLNLNYTSDGIHLNDQGYTAWVNKIRHLIKEPQ